jgi:NAD(P)-dependent dehydrogenase (short-subunit alcohol dehydrogenase family)
MVSLAVETFGRLDILFSNAGISGANGLDEVTEADWDKAMAVNLKAGFFSTKFAVQQMRKNGGGSIIFTGSVAGLVGTPRSPLYCATKGGITLLTESLALMLAKDNIRVNTICPGPIATPMVDEAFARGGAVSGYENAADLETAKKALIDNVPLGRRGLPVEVAYAALFLASDDSSFITGIALPVDGGYTAR